MRKLFAVRAVKILSLLLAVLAAVSVSQGWLFQNRERDPWRMKGFRMEPGDSLDVVLIGSSDIYTGFSSAYAYEMEGFTSYPYTVAGCPVTLWKAMLEETLHLQSPQLIVVDINGACYLETKDLHNNMPLHFVADEMPLSPLKHRLLREQCDVHTDSPWYFVFPILKYHTVWNDGIMESNYNDMCMLRDRGCALLRGVSTTTAASPPPDGIRDVSADFSEQELASEAEQALLEFLENCRQRDLDVLFTFYPRQIGLSDSNKVYSFFRRANRAERIIREYGFPVLNMARMPEKLGIDPEHDYYNENHLNIFGQRKATEFLARYLVEECGVKPRQQSAENAQKWSQSAEYYRLYSAYAENAISTRTHETVAETAELIQQLVELNAENS